MDSTTPNTNDDNIPIEETKTSSEHTAEVIQERKQNRKIDISLILSIAALLVSLFQLIVSSPFFTDYYYKAGFEITEEPPSVRNKIFTTTYIIQNKSKNTANNIELSFQLLASDSVQIIPSLNKELTFKENGTHFKVGFLSLDKLVPNESFVITIDSEVDSVIYYNSTFFKTAKPVKNDLEEDTPKIKFSDWELENLVFPAIGQAKFEKGFAKVTRQPIKQTLLKLQKLRRDTIK